MAHTFFIRFFYMLSSVSIAQITVLSFIVISLIGGSLLWVTERDRLVSADVPVHTPVTLYEKAKDGRILSTRDDQIHTYTKQVTYRGEHFIDMLFTAVSALCVTGLTSTNFSHFTLAGQIITLLLIQMGGLGIIFCTSIIALGVARRVSEHSTFKKLFSGILDTHEDYVSHMITHILLYTFLFEGAGTPIMGTYL